ncbi:RNA-splicing ligase RtcB, partial [bacterium]
HWGYGPPIGAVFATDPEGEGVVAPGGIGFDINCLCGESLILHEFGYTFPIKKSSIKHDEGNIQCYDLIKGTLDKTFTKLFIKSKPRNKVYRLRTFTGKEIVATGDHPFWTPDGMKEMFRLHVDSQVAINSFQGIPFEQPDDKIIISIKNIEDTLMRFGKGPESQSGRIIIRKLKERGLIPLSYNYPKLPYLIKIMGMLFGDGTMNFIGKRRDGIIGFYSKNKKDLEEIKRDLAILGYNSSRVYISKTKLVYKGKIKYFRNYRLCVNASSLLVLLSALGVPVGRKVAQQYSMPRWLKSAPLWQKRLFLAGLFGAELTTPRPKLSKKANFYAPVFSMNKREKYLRNGLNFLQEIIDLAKEFGVQATDLLTRKKYYISGKEPSWHLEIVFSCKPESLINLWSKIGFIYNRRRCQLANLAVHYLSFKQKVIQKRSSKIREILALKASGLTHNEVFQQVGGEFVGKRYIQSVAQRENNIVEPRIPNNFPNYKKFKEEATGGLGSCDMVWDRVETIEEVKFDDYVYDFTVEHPHHNFIANNFVVSNCGVRLVKTNFQYDDIKPKLKELVFALFSDVPCGVGSKGDIRVTSKEERQILVKGSKWAVEQGFGAQEDLECTEEYGAIPGADPEAVSERAYERGRAQAGTLGSGNHFLEVQVIDQLYGREECDSLGLTLGQVVVMIHSGSRGFGYQICEDYVRRMMPCLRKYGINVPDRQLVCAPVNSPEAKQYLGAMRCAANYAWNNRQCLMHLTRKTFEKIFGMSWQKMGMSLIYDVAHNIAKLEKYEIGGKEKTLCVHRKGATRAFGPGHSALPERYKKIGQPVIIPGDMGRNSYLLVGTQKAMEETFGSTCHGAGRLKSRTAAARSINSDMLLKELESKGIMVKASGRRTIVEEAPEAYKDVNEVVDVVHNAGISKRVCRMRPVGVIKG